MFLPISDTPNPPGRAYVTWLLIGANLGIYLLLTLPALFSQVDLRDPVLHEYLRSVGLLGKVSAREVYQNINDYDLLVFQYGFRPAEFSLATLFSYQFLHGGFMHLAGNLIYLFIFGDNVEFRLGRTRFLLIYLFCGCVAGLFFALFSSNSHVPLIGASGAISGVLGCYFLWFPRNRVRCILVPFPFSFYLPARFILGFYLVFTNVVPFLSSASQESSIAYGAHIGGFLAGLGIALLVDQYYQLRRGWVHREPREIDVSLNSLRRICPAVLSGDLAGASLCYLNLDKREERIQVDSADVMVVGRYLLEQGRLPEALHLYRRFIAERQNDERIDQAYLGAGRAMLLDPRYRTSAYHYFLSALDLARSEQLAAEARLYLRMLEQQATEG